MKRVRRRCYCSGLFKAELGRAAVRHDHGLQDVAGIGDDVELMTLAEGEAHGIVILEGGAVATVNRYAGDDQHVGLAEHLQCQAVVLHRDRRGHPTHRREWYWLGVCPA